MIPERRRPKHLKRPSERPRRHPVEKRSYRAVHLLQGVTRMSRCPHRPPHPLQIPKPGNVFPFPKGLPPSSPQSLCLSWRMLTHHDPRHLHRHKMAIQPSPARALHDQHLPENHSLLHLFLTVHSRQQQINLSRKSCRIFLRVPRQRNRRLLFLVPCPVPRIT